MKVCVRLGRPGLIGLGMKFWSQLSLLLEICFHFLNDRGMGAESSASGVTIDYLAYWHIVGSLH